MQWNGGTIASLLLSITIALSSVPFGTQNTFYKYIKKIYLLLYKMIGISVWVPNGTSPDEYSIIEEVHFDSI